MDARWFDLYFDFLDFICINSGACIQSKGISHAFVKLLDDMEAG